MTHRDFRLLFASVSLAAPKGAANTARPPVQPPRRGVSVGKGGFTIGKARR